MVNPPPATPDPVNPPASLTLTRPLLTYPAVALTGAYPDPAALLTADLPAAIAAQREPGLPDPDVAMVRIVVEAQGLVQDPLASDGGYLELYQTTRPFPADLTQPLTLDLSWTDIHDAATLAAPTAGPLLLPTARNLRLLLSALGRADPHQAYFGAEDVRLGPAATVDSASTRPTRPHSSRPICRPTASARSICNRTRRSMRPCCSRSARPAPAASARATCPRVWRHSSAWSMMG